ncbi:MAG: DUF3696 domain-containing protein [Rhodospirillaceae bacterium]|nr:DUF3696 domain-containing protein [Rhodospirillales bacterium]
MIEGIEFKNFKCFRRQPIDLAPLTLLAGLNGTGKSSVIQSIIMLSQLGEHSYAMRGPWLDLGTFHDMHSYFADDAQTKVDFQLDKGVPASFSFTMKDTEVSDLNVDLPGHVFRALTFLSADRWGPRVTMPIADDRDWPHHVGRHGEYVAHFMHVYGTSEIGARVHPHGVGNANLPSHPASSSRLLRDQVTAWLSEISPGVTPDFGMIPRADVSYSSYRFKAGTDTTPLFRPTHVGFGLSYCLPVIVALVSAAPGALVLIENPEAHLHPAGQTAMGRLIAMVANAGVQVVVETHSDHVLDGIRIAVKRGHVSNDKVAIHYFSRGENGESVVSSPTIDPDGMIDEWPDGFFDQGILNMAELGAPREEGQS